MVTAMGCDRFAAEWAFCSGCPFSRSSASKSSFFVCKDLICLSCSTSRFWRSDSSAIRVVSLALSIAGAALWGSGAGSGDFQTAW